MATGGDEKIGLWEYTCRSTISPVPSHLASTNETPAVSSRMSVNEQDSSRRSFSNFPEANSRLGSTAFGDTALSWTMPSGTFSREIYRPKSQFTDNGGTTKKRQSPCIDIPSAPSTQSELTDSQRSKRLRQYPSTTDYSSSGSMNSLNPSIIQEPTDIGRKLVPKDALRLPKIADTMSRGKRLSTTLNVAKVPLKLVDFMTASSFFDTIVPIWQQMKGGVGFSNVKVTFGWKEETDLDKHIVILKDFEETYEAFLRIIDQAPCWDKAGGTCIVNVEPAVGAWVPY